MNKIDILKMAFEKAESAQEAMSVARQMAAFINEGQPIKTAKLILEPPPRENFIKRRAWTNDEINTLVEFMRQGKNTRQIAVLMKRSKQSIRLAVYKLYTGRQLGKKKAA
jgi:hypothetical protein